MKQSPVAVTGASGYIGSALVRRLVESDTTGGVIAIDRLQSSNGTRARNIDLSEASCHEVASCLEGIDVLFHLAAARNDWGLDYAAYERDNLIATRRLIEAARIAGIRQWIYFGTVGVYGPSAVPLDEMAPFNPETDYARTKAKAEEELVVAATIKGWNIRILRPSAVYSELQPNNTNLYRLIEAIRKRHFVLIGDGSEVKTISYLHNVVDAALWLYRDLPGGGIKAYNYIDEPRLTTRQMIDIIRNQLGIRSPLARLPLDLVERPARVLDWLSKRIGRDLPITSARIRKFCTPTNVDASRIRQAGFVPSYTSMEGLVRTVRWHHERALSLPEAKEQGKSSATDI